MIIKEKIILKSNEKYTVIKAILRRWYETFDNDNNRKYTTIALKTEKPNEFVLYHGDFGVVTKEFKERLMIKDVVAILGYNFLEKVVNQEKNQTLLEAIVSFNKDIKDYVKTELDPNPDWEYEDQIHTILGVPKIIKLIISWLEIYWPKTQELPEEGKYLGRCFYIENFHLIHEKYSPMTKKTVETFEPFRNCPETIVIDETVDTLDALELANEMAKEIIYGSWPVDVYLTGRFETFIDANCRRPEKDEGYIGKLFCCHNDERDHRLVIQWDKLDPKELLTQAELLKFEESFTYEQAVEILSRTDIEKRDIRKIWENLMAIKGDKETQELIKKIALDAMYTGKKLYWGIDMDYLSLVIEFLGDEVALERLTEKSMDVLKASKYYKNGVIDFSSIDRYTLEDIKK